MNPKGKYEPTLRFVASPLAVPGYIVVPTAKNYGVVCLKPDGSGDVSENAEVIRWKWKSNTPDVPSPLLVDGLVYLCRENGNLICRSTRYGDDEFCRWNPRWTGPFRIQVRNLGASVWALATEEPGIIGLMSAPGEGPSLQDLVSHTSLDITVHDGFEYWIDDIPERDAAMEAALEQANSGVMPTSRLSSVEAAYWTNVGTKEHLRWVMPHGSLAS